MKITINQELRVDEDGRKYLYTEYDKKFDSGVPYSSKAYLPSDEELAVIDYNEAKATALSDIATIKENIELGTATDADLQARKDEWLAYHNENNPY